MLKKRFSDKRLFIKVLTHPRGEGLMLKVLCVGTMLLFLRGCKYCPIIGFFLRTAADKHPYT